MFQVPVKRIITKQDLEEFLQSDAYNSYIGFIVRLNDAVKDLKIDTELDLSPVIIMQNPSLLCDLRKL